MSFYLAAPWTFGSKALHIRRNSEFGADTLSDEATALVLKVTHVVDRRLYVGRFCPAGFQVFKQSRERLVEFRRLARC
jgi:hypothetical protein